MATIIYLHGFGSNNQTEKVGFLKEAFPGHRVVAPNIPARAMEAYLTIDKFIEAELERTAGQVILVGTSLGGFWARMFAAKSNLDSVVMNPSLNPVVTLKRYAGGKNNCRVEGWTEADAEAYAQLPVQLVNKCRGTILLEEGDEILDSFATFNKYEHTDETILIPGGEHRFVNLDILQEKIREIVGDAVV